MKKNAFIIGIITAISLIAFQSIDARDGGGRGGGGRSSASGRGNRGGGTRDGQGGRPAQRSPSMSRTSQNRANQRPPTRENRGNTRPNNTQNRPNNPNRPQTVPNNRQNRPQQPGNKRPTPDGVKEFIKNRPNEPVRNNPERKDQFKEKYPYDRNQRGNKVRNEFNSHRNHSEHWFNDNFWAHHHHYPPYQEGMRDHLPEIRLKNVNPNDQFTKLANTLNSLTSKIQKNIDTITEERNQKEAILESLIEGVVAVDNDMVVTYANDTSLKFLALNREEFVGQNFSVAKEAEGYATLLQCQLEKRPVTGSLNIEKSGMKSYLDVVAVPLGEEKGAILVLQDKSSHYRLLEMRKDFIANASHELKTPITIIRGFAETLHDNPTLPKETTEQITQKIVNNCVRMTTLIRDLLTLSDVENIPESRLIECEITEIFTNCSDHVRTLYPDAEIAIRTLPEGAEMNLIADHNLIELAMMNLVENGAKYSARPAHIDILIEKIDGQLVIAISDKGMGIPKEDIEHIFERFYTVNKAHSQKLGGSGLGLSIVQTIIQKHFGTIQVTSEVGKGTTFTITLPVTP